AMSQAALDQRHFASAYDLAREVPALVYRNSGPNQGAQVAIRGVYSTTGAATTGTYLDDVPLQRRNIQNAGAGTVIPQLFDLARVEVLRGPQGTLYGGSSVGGAIRFITPTPSLTEYSGLVRAETSMTKGGNPSADVGAAIGGPIVQDKLGFRVSLVAGRKGGWIDHVHPISGLQTFKNSNDADRTALRAALKWAVNDNFTIEPSYYYGLSDTKDANSIWFNAPAFTVPSATFGATGRPATGAAVTFTRPAINYPALTYYGNRTTSGEYSLTPRREALAVYGLNMAYDLGPVTFRSITSYEFDSTKGSGASGAQNSLQDPYFSGFFITAPEYQARVTFDSDNSTFAQEFRLSSRSEQRLTWVAGAFYSRNIVHVNQRVYENVEQVVRTLRGVSSLVYYGVDAASVNNVSLNSDQKFEETSLAAFGEATFAVTDKLKLTAGTRYSVEDHHYTGCDWGINRGSTTCSFANGGQVDGKQKAKPFTPKGSISYQIDEQNMVYTTVSRGFRNGGVNRPPPAGPNCDALTQTIGNYHPGKFKPDEVTNYELGAKSRLGPVSLNASIYKIDWTGIQLLLSSPQGSGCLFNFIANAGKATSQGVDLTAQVRLTQGLTAELNLAYTDSQYTETTRSPSLTATPGPIIVNKGDKLAVPPRTASLGLEYRFNAFGGRDAYFQGNYQYTSRYVRSLGPGTSAYTPDVMYGPATDIFNARVGAVFGSADVSVFVKNLFDSRDIVAGAEPPYATGVRVGCANAACATFARTNFQQTLTSTFRPREVGLTVNYRF
ncbi:MAG: TonB-dependent receptor, partial [Steroidobacteraceae bacterium]